MAKGRTAKGNITAKQRAKSATYGKSFPIFDKHSAKSALHLIGHAPEAEQPKIRSRAEKFLHTKKADDSVAKKPAPKQPKEKEAPKKTKKKKGKK